MSIDVLKVHRCLNNFESVNCTWNTFNILLHTLIHAIRYYYLHINYTNAMKSIVSTACQYLQLSITSGFFKNVHFFQKAFCFFSQFFASPKKYHRV